MNRIKEIREAKGISQEQLAQIMETDVATVQAWESEKIRPSQATLYVLAVRLKCTQEQLLGLEDGIGEQLTLPPFSQFQASIPENPILCPHCKSRNIAFVTEYHKEIVLHIFAFIAGILAVIFGINVFYGRNDSSIGVFIFFAAVFLFIEIAILTSESKTHVECICKDCGHTWLHN